MSDRKFILNSTELGRVTLEDDPNGWDTVKRTFTRNIKYLGVFRKRTATLQFIGDGLEYCVELFELSGTEAELNVIVMQKRDYEDAWDTEFEGIGKFNPFDLDWGDDLSPSLSIEFEDSGFHNKFLTRVAMDINVGQQLSVEGVDMGAIPTKPLKVHQRQITEGNEFELSANTSYWGGIFADPGEPYIKSDEGHVLPLEKIKGDTDFIQSPAEYLIVPEPGLVCDFVTQLTAITINYHIAGSGNARLSFLSSVPDYVRWSVRVFTDSTDLTIFTDYLLHEEDGLSIGDPSPFSFDFTGTLNLTLGIGHAMTLVFYPEDVPGGVPAGYECVYTVTDVDVNVIQNFDSYNSNCHWRYEFMERLVQLMTDQEDCFESTMFGRTDIGYIANGPFYNNVCFNGKQLRGFPNVYPVRSFEKSFKSARSIWNAGVGIEKFGTRYKVVVEELPYFFKGDISVTLHNVRKVKRSVNEQFTFSEVHVGYEKAEYEQVNGLEEYNNKSKFATFIKSDNNILDLISPDRADGYGMEFARRKNIFVAATEDTPYDEEVFTAMVYEDEGQLKTEQDENYDSVLNIQSPESATNLDITPQRNLIRNGDWISGCCKKYPTEILKFISADKATDLVSTRTGDAAAVSEQTNLTNGNLKSSLWLNLNYSFESDVTPDQIRAMELKPHSLVKWSPYDRKTTRKYYYGWLMEITAGGKERSGTFVLLAANINSDRLKIIDPEGVDNTLPPVPPVIPPGEDAEMGFEYGFEHVMES